MKTRLLWLLLIPFLAVFVVPSLVSVSARKPSPETVFDHKDWIYYHHLGIYLRLFSDPDLSKEQKVVLGVEGYGFFFEYWVLHRSTKAQLAPVEHFEQSFAKMLKKYAIPYLDADDPVAIRPYYTDGRFIGKPLPKVEGVEFKIPESARLPHVEGLPGKEFKTWEGYQKYVSDFRRFFDAASQPPKR